jgi:hypothetical protein
MATQFSLDDALHEHPVSVVTPMDNSPPDGGTESPSRLS